MDLVDCRLVVNIARSKSLTQGGKDTFLSLPAASLRLKALESELGLRLFHRKHHGMELTDAGRCFLHYAESILENVDKLHSRLQEFNDRSRRFLRVAGNTSYVTDVLPILVRNYLSVNPEVSIDLQSARKGEIEKGVIEDRIDIGFISSSTSNFSVEPIDFGPDPMVVIVPADSPLGGLIHIDMQRFAQCEHVVLGDQSTLTGYLRERFADYGLQMNVRVSVADYKTMHDMVAAGIGVGLIHESLAKRYNHPDVRRVVLDVEWSQHRRYALLAEGARSIHYANDFLAYVVANWLTVSAS